MIESARKHGPFDSRYPRKHSRLTFVPAGAGWAPSGEAADRLDWQAFSARFFAGRDRHDLEVLEAYEAHRNGSQACERYRDGSQAYETHRREAAFVSASLQAWEGEGGAPLEPGAPSRQARAAAQAPPRAGVA
jgi:hypothetical protein